MSGLELGPIEPIERTLSDGGVYTFSPISPAGWSAFCRWINKRNDRPVMTIVPLVEMFGAADAVDGMLFLAHYSASKNHAKLDRNKFDELLTMTDLTKIIPQIIDLPDADEGTEGSDPQALEPLESSR